MYHCTSMSWVFHHFQKRGRKKGLRWSVLNVPNRSVSCADLGMAGLHAVTGGQALLQQRRKLLRELLPVLFPDLVLEAVQDLGGRKHKTRQSCRLSSLKAAVQLGRLVHKLFSSLPTCAVRNFFAEQNADLPLPPTPSPQCYNSFCASTYKLSTWKTPHLNTTVCTMFASA